MEVDRQRECCQVEIQNTLGETVIKDKKSCLAGAVATWTAGVKANWSSASRCQVCPFTQGAIPSIQFNTTTVIVRVLKKKWNMKGNKINSLRMSVLYLQKVFFFVFFFSSPFTMMAIRFHAATYYCCCVLLWGRGGGVILNNCYCCLPVVLYCLLKATLLLIVIIGNSCWCCLLIKIFSTVSIKKNKIR